MSCSNCATRGYRSRVSIARSKVNILLLSMKQGFNSYTRPRSVITGCQRMAFEFKVLGVTRLKACCCCATDPGGFCMIHGRLYCIDNCNRAEGDTEAPPRFFVCYRCVAPRLNRAVNDRRILHLYLPLTVLLSTACLLLCCFSRRCCSSAASSLTYSHGVYTFYFLHDP